MPSHTMNSSGELERIVVDRPDTNTFISHATPTNGYNTVTLGRKTSTLSWAGGSPRSRSFRSLGRNGTMSLLHTPSSSKRHINDYGRSPTPHLNVRNFLLNYPTMRSEIPKLLLRKIAHCSKRSTLVMKSKFNLVQKLDYRTVCISLKIYSVAHEIIDRCPV